VKLFVFLGFYQALWKSLENLVWWIDCWMPPIIENFKQLIVGSPPPPISIQNLSNLSGG
jgi:hypothetical protein